MKLNCWIVDDEPLALSLLESYVLKTPFLNLAGKYNGASSAMNDLRTSKVDLIFLDIQMPEVSGMEFARLVDSHTRIVFTTAFSNYALEGYRVSALDYLLKPFSYADFLVAAKKALDWFELTASASSSGAPAEKENGIFVKSEYRLVHILFNDILYIEGLKDYVKIYTAAEPKPILSLTSLLSLEKFLSPERFIRVHRSFIIAKDKIESINKNRIVIRKREIPIGDTYRQKFFSLIEPKNA
jgi:DNA-binding LytR/AlgR family response regulator